MKKIIFVFAATLLMTGCEEVKQTGDETAREITGSNLIKQGQKTQQQLLDINQQQKERYEQLEQQQ